MELWPRISAAAFVVTLVLPGVAQANEPHSSRDIDVLADIGEVPFDGTYDVSGASLRDGEAQPSCAQDEASVWFRLTAASRMQLEIDTVGSQTDTTLTVYEQASLGLSEVTCNDDEALAATSRVRFWTESGTTYFVRVGFVDGGNLLNLHVRDQAHRQPTWTAYQLDEMEVGVPQGTTVLSGISYCWAPAYLRLVVEVDQAITGAKGTADSVIVCDQATPWEVLVTPADMPFVIGPAHVKVADYECDPAGQCLGFAFEADVLLLRLRT